MSPLFFALFSNMALLATILILQPLWRGLKHGFPYALGNFDNRKPPTIGELRLAMVRSNQLEALGLFIPVVLLLVHLELNNHTLLYAAYTHITARVLYTIVSLAGIPILRTGLWAVAFLAWIDMASDIITQAF